MFITDDGKKPIIQKSATAEYTSLNDEQDPVDDTNPADGTGDESKK